MKYVIRCSTIHDYIAVIEADSVEDARQICDDMDGDEFTDAGEVLGSRRDVQRVLPLGARQHRAETWGGRMTGKRSPWGRIQWSRRVADGIWFVSTAGHGGYKLDRKRNATVDACWRRAGGWYEEDCEWAIAALTFPDEVCDGTTENIAAAHRAARRYFPKQYSEAMQNG